MHVVTGGAGFIGSNILAGLDARGLRPLVCVDRLRDGEKWRNIANRELYDVVDPEKLPRFLAAYEDRIETVIHMGAVSATTERDADLIVNTNFRLTRYLWSWCAETEKRFIYASSAATYGDGAEGFADDQSLAALAKLKPLNTYGWSKQLFDRWALRSLADGEAAPRQWAGLKFFNVYGPNEYHKGRMRSVVNQVYPKAAGDEACTLFQSHHPDYEDGGQLRDFVWVGDVVDIVLWLLEHPDVDGLYNCGSGKARSFKDLASAVYRALDKKPMIDFAPTPEDIRDKYQYYTEAPMGKLREAGYDGQPTPLEEGVRRYVRNYLSQNDPFV